jgi:RND superfamily putative drug exporter
MLALSYLMLVITFRSVLLPLKAIVMNLLSLGASYGALVLVFQDGFGVGLLRGAQAGDVTNFVPLLLLATIFSLTTDYEVFLLSRIREEYRAGLDNTRAVAAGMARTAPVISGAAILMIAVFGAFAFAGILPIQQLGFGMAFAVAVDVTVIRLVVVPATMRLLGDWNWWLPRRPRASRRQNAIRA